jgi:hypothetical protein
LLEDRRRRKSVGIAAGKHAQENKAYLPHAVIEQRTPELTRDHRPAAALLNVVENPLPLISVSHLASSGTGRQVDQEDDAQQDGRQPFEQKQPLPAGQSGLALEIEKGSCDQAPMNTEPAATRCRSG